MPGVILENLSGRKLFVLVSVLMVLLVACFLIGGLVAPPPSNAEHFIAIKCFDYDNTSWFYTRGEGRCNEYNLHYHIDIENDQIADKVVFVFQIPTPKDNIILDYSRWQQNLIGVLSFEIMYDGVFEMPNDVLLTMDVKLGYRNRGDKDYDWKLYASSTVERHLDCSIGTKKKEYNYNCSIVPLFELGSLHHDYYLLNIRFPVDQKTQINTNLGDLEDLGLVAINQNGGFTVVWLILKTTFFPLIILTMMWFWNRVHQLKRSPVLLEYMILSLGGTLTLLNAPFEWLTLYFDLPFMPLFIDIRQGIFYASLLSFWLVFAGEHLMINDPQPHHLSIYVKHLSAVAIGCISLLIFDLFEKGSQVTNPFYSIWVTSLGTNLALTFIICAGISASIYFIFLCYMIWKVFCNINVKRSSLPSMSSVRRLHYEGIIYRFKFLMLATLTCAAMTVIGFILDQVSDGRWKWDEHIEIEYTSAFLTGVYGMWNIYILALIILYSPSHKQWPSDVDLISSAGDEIELSRISANEPNEISLLTSLAKKVSGD
ncbi:hypothetical protein PGB90_002271 [Kerria lacca]